ncbi:MAG: PSD1 and planctomycete cytochrome C domain-containing protein [Pirellulales bacterium]|nr:PSD1 and planctomycete cytochrome C domain-containing protein [Pirellulales bacterium]
MNTLFRCAAIASAVAALTCQKSFAKEPAIDFDRQIRPILSQHCFHCHGPDPKHRQAGLRFDKIEDATSELESGDIAIVPGKPEESSLVARIFTKDVDEVMPPPDSNRDLSEKQKVLLKQWIADGAKFEEHWAFVPPKRPALPKVSKADWPRNPIDHFVLARLDREKLSPLADADKATLIRRVTLDLTGLPPTPEEVDAFLADKSPNAYEKVVDRLLASPRYGERMAWPWLDAARYADTAGYQGDPTRPQWPWRDWVVNALNNNMPFDQFTIEQLAGDRLPNATVEQKLATAFNRNHMHNGEGGRIAEETRVENVFDRTETTGTVWMGLTLTCARCHDHKFDPVSNAEYFSLYDFFNQSSERGQTSQASRAIAPAVAYQPQSAAKRKLEHALASAKAKVLAPDAALDAAQRKWETTERNSRPAPLIVSPWHVVGPLPAPGGDAAKMFDHIYPPEQNIDLKAKVAGKHTWSAKSKLVDGKVHELSSAVGVTYLHRTITASRAQSIAVSLGSDDAIKFWVNGKLIAANNAARAAAPDQEKAVMPLIAGKNEILMKIVNTGGISGFYYRTNNKTPSYAVALAKTPKDRTAQESATIRAHYRRNVAPNGAKRFEQVDRLTAELKKHQATSKPIQVMTMDHLAKPRQTFVLVGGAYNKKTDQVVTANVPDFLPPLTKQGKPDRLSLAKWLVTGEHPLTARVTVNRYWQTFFGRGIVTTPGDFGVQGSRPSHPDLLDWLATEFVSSKWNVKHMHRLIVTSATYRQSSRVTRELIERDPKNILLARAPRHRLPSWMLRDQALAASGLFVGTVGGPPVKPYQPGGIWADATFGKIRYSQDKGDALYRRSLYVFWRRIVGPTMFFDVAKRQTCEVKPNLTNTPLHALTTFNETAYVEASRALAESALNNGGKTDASRIAFAFRRLTARPPTAEESQILTARFKSLRDHYAADTKARDALLKVGAFKSEAKLDPTEYAAMTAVCNLMLNLDEVLSKQ